MCILPSSPAPVPAQDQDPLEGSDLLDHSLEQSLGQSFAEHSLEHSAVSTALLDTSMQSVQSLGSDFGQRHGPGSRERAASDEPDAYDDGNALSDSELDDADLQRAILSSMELPPAGTADARLFQRRISNCLEEKHLALPRTHSLLLAICKAAYGALVRMEARPGPPVRPARALAAYAATHAVWLQALEVLRLGLPILSSPSELRALLVACCRFPEDWLFMLPAITGAAVSTASISAVSVGALQWQGVGAGAGLGAEECASLLAHCRRSCLADAMVPAEGNALNAGAAPEQQLQQLVQQRRRHLASSAVLLLHAGMAQLLSGPALGPGPDPNSHRQLIEAAGEKAGAEVRSVVEGCFDCIHVDASAIARLPPLAADAAILPASFTGLMLPLLAALLLQRGKGEHAYVVPSALRLLSIPIPANAAWLQQQMRWAVLFLAAHLQELMSGVTLTLTLLSASGASAAADSGRSSDGAATGLGAGLRLLASLLDALRPAPTLLCYLDAAVQAPFSELWCTHGLPAPVPVLDGDAAGASLAVALLLDDIDARLCCVHDRHPGLGPTCLSLLSLAHTAAVSHGRASGPGAARGKVPETLARLIALLADEALPAPAHAHALAPAPASTPASSAGPCLGKLTQALHMVPHYTPLRSRAPVAAALAPITRAVQGLARGLTGLLGAYHTFLVRLGSARAHG